MGSKGPSSEAKAAKAEYERLIGEYQAARADYQKLAAENTGVAGYKKSVDEAKGVASNLTQGQSQAAANQAIQAGRAAGMNKAAAAMNAQNAAANTYANAYTDNFNAQQSQVANQLGAQMQAAGESNNMILQQANLQNQAYANQRMYDDKKDQSTFWNQYGAPIVNTTTQLGAAWLAGGGGNPFAKKGV